MVEKLVFLIFLKWKRQRHVFFVFYHVEGTTKLSLWKLKNILIDELLNNPIDIMLAKRRERERVLNVEKHLKSLKENGLGC